MNVKQVWDRVVGQVKLKVIHPTLWRTLEMAVPIAAENDQFVIGLAAADSHLSGHLTSSEHKNAIETALREFTGIAFTLRVIEGDSEQDWLAAKAKDERMQEIKEEAYRKHQAETAVTKSWEGLLETIGRMYANTPLRMLPQFRAQYLEKALATISETMDVLMPEGAPRDEIAERSLARVIEKVGTLAEVPPAWIGFEVMRLRGR
jgi:hypothetical protein